MINMFLLEKEIEIAMNIKNNSNLKLYKIIVARETKNLSRNSFKFLKTTKRT